MYCFRCGALLVPNARFCSQCGQKIPEPEKENNSVAADTAAADTVVDNGPVIDAAVADSTLVDIDWTRLPIQAESFGTPYCSVIIPCNAVTAELIADKILKVFRTLGWCGQRCRQIIYGKADVSIGSFGEELSAEILEDKIIVKSISSVSITMADFGKNRKNIESFLYAMAAEYR